MEWFTWVSFASILGVGLTVLRLWDRGVKQAVYNERRFTIIEADVKQSQDADQRHDAYLKELRETNTKILETLSDMKADLRVLKNGG